MNILEKPPPKPKPKIRCFTCVNARSNAECNAAGKTTCQSSTASCMNEVRVFGYGEKLITKKCKDRKACADQQAQNKAITFLGAQCQPDWFESHCRCCCQGDLCNSGELGCLGAVSII